MSMYQHVAECNPDGSYLVLHKFGYADQPINSIDDGISESPGTIVFKTWLHPKANLH